ncbi:Unknown protein, partial [Striga hermonthica]
FLATLEVEKTGYDQMVKTMKFRFDNKSYTINTKTLEKDIYQASKDPNLPSSFNANDVWSLIAETPTHPAPRYIPKSTKATSIRNPVLRFLQKVVASTIFARGEMGGCSLRELTAIWCMLK